MGIAMALFARIRDWFRRRRDDNRCIFTYWDGRRTRKADPLAVLFRLKSDALFDLETHGVLIDDGDIEAIEIGASAMRQAFDLPAFEAGGLTNAECASLLMDFIYYLDALKKNGNGPVTSLPATEFTLQPPAETPTSPQ